MNVQPAEMWKAIAAGCSIDRCCIFTMFVVNVVNVVNAVIVGNHASALFHSIGFSTKDALLSSCKPDSSLV